MNRLPALDSGSAALHLAWLVALAATLGALFVGEVMGREPCVLCWYQRMAMAPLAVILTVACLASDPGVRRYALPIAVIGAAVALWHSLLFLGLAPETVRPCTRDGPSCTDRDQTLLGVLPLPLLSLAAFLSIATLLSLPARTVPVAGHRGVVAGILVAAVALFAAGAALYDPETDPAETASPADGDLRLVRDHAPVLGPPEAPVTIVEIFDPVCSACRDYYPIVKRIIADHPGKVRVVLRYAAFHRASEEAIRVLEAARQQGVFEPVLERLLATQRDWTPHRLPVEAVWDQLEGTGLNLERARRDARSPGVQAVLDRDAADIAGLGVRLTPAFFVDGTPLETFGEAHLRALVETAVNPR